MPAGVTWITRPAYITAIDRALKSMSESELIKKRADWIAASVEILVQRVCVALLAGFVMCYLAVSFFILSQQ